MTAITKSFRFRVATAGASAVTGNVDWTETVNLTSVGEIGGQTVHPTKGQTTARPWTVEIVDVSEVITARLADANGRAHLLRRLADISVSTDSGATWTILATARIDRIEMIDVTSFAFEMQDERLIERTTTIFKGSNTTRLLPQGLNAAWLGYQVARPLAYQVTAVDAGNNTSTYLLQPLENGAPQSATVSPRIMDLLEADVVDNPAANAANFTALRAAITTVGSYTHVDRSIVEINGSPVTDPLKLLRSEPTQQLRTFKVAGYQDTNGVTQLVYFHQQSRDPSPELPLHIGGQAGIDPFTLVKDIYDGDYQNATDPAVVRYDAARLVSYDATTAPNGLINNPRFPKMHFRITGPENMATWLEDNIYGPLGVTPFVNAAGEVSPRLTLMPAVDQVADPDTLPELTAANLTLPHPSWRNEGRELVTVVEVTFEYALAPSFITQSSGGGGGLFGGLFKKAGAARLPTDGGQDGTGLDLLQPKSVVISRDHDRAATMGRMVHQVTVRGIHRTLDQRRFADKFALDMFERFGDGPIYTDAVPLSSAASPVEGDLVRINLPGSYPALQNLSRTGERIAQVLSKVYGIDGVRFDLLEAGPNSQPFSAPSINLAANTNDPENAIECTVSGLEADGHYEVHLSVGGSEPAASSSDWQYRHLRGQAVGSTTATVTVRGLPAGSTIWGRARETGVGRISSDWSARDSQATTALTAPSAMADSGLSGDAATESWTNGEASFDVMVDLLVTAGSVQAKAPVRLAAGSTRYRFTGLAISTGYTARVWHVDSYGGESTKATDTFTTTGTAQTLTAPVALTVLVGIAA